MVQHVYELTFPSPSACFCLQIFKVVFIPHKSDLVPVLSLLICDNAGGYTWFSCAINSSRSPSRICKLRTGTKSDLVGCMENVVPTQENAPNPMVQVIILDGAAIVNMLRPDSAKTFSDYVKQVFSPYIKSQLHHVSRMDVVWDEYHSESLKAETRRRRGKGSARPLASPERARGEGCCLCPTPAPPQSARL